MVLEALGQFEAALTDYRAVLAVQPGDPAGWNNLGNASAGLGRWHDAADFYGKAASLAPELHSLLLTKLWPCSSWEKQMNPCGR